MSPTCVWRHPISTHPKGSFSESLNDLTKKRPFSGFTPWGLVHPLQTQSLVHFAFAFKHGHLLLYSPGWSEQDDPHFKEWSHVHLVISGMPISITGSNSNGSTTVASSCWELVGTWRAFSVTCSVIALGYNNSCSMDSGDLSMQDSSGSTCTM